MDSNDLPTWNVIVTEDVEQDLDNYVYYLLVEKMNDQAATALLDDYDETIVELSEMMDKSRRTVQMLMKELLDEGAIERIGSKKKGSWLVK